MLGFYLFSTLLYRFWLKDFVRIHPYHRLVYSLHKSVTLFTSKFWIIRNGCNCALFIPLKNNHSPLCFYCSYGNSMHAATLSFIPRASVCMINLLWHLNTQMPLKILIHNKCLLSSADEFNPPPYHQHLKVNTYSSWRIRANKAG